MALTIIQTRVLEQIQALANTEVTNKATLTRLIGMWANEFPVAPTTAELQTDFAHMTQEELVAAAGALSAINTTLGEFNVPTSNVVKLLKIVTQTK